MKLTIVIDDNIVIVDGAIFEIGMEAISVPSGVHALQWETSSGEIELNDGLSQVISALPSWANDCVAAHAAAVAAAAANAPTAIVEARMKRDALIAETDWWASSDLTMTVAQSAYRQALRDITDQAGFPYSITWPEKP